MVERAGFTPGIDRAAIEYQVLEFGRDGGAGSAAGNPSIGVEVPALTEAQLGTVVRTVREARERVLARMSTSDVITLVDRAIARLLDRNDPYRRKAEVLLPAITGYDREMVRLGLTEYLMTFRAHELQRFVAEDFANPMVLDSFQPTPKGGFLRALGPEILTHVWSGNVPAPSNSSRRNSAAAPLSA